MRRKRPHVASLDEVRITRQADEAIIEYADERIWTTHFKLGPAVQHMTDQEILDQWNECVLAQEQLAAEHEHIAVEIPPGKPQIEYFDKGYPVDAARRPPPLPDRRRRTRRGTRDHHRRA